MSIDATVGIVPADYISGTGRYGYERRNDFYRPAVWHYNRWLPLRRSWHYVPVEGRV